MIELWWKPRSSRDQTHGLNCLLLVIANHYCQQASFLAEISLHHGLAMEFVETVFSTCLSMFSFTSEGPED